MNKEELTKLLQSISVEELQEYANKKFRELLIEESSNNLIENFVDRECFDLEKLPQLEEQLKQAHEKQKNLINFFADDLFHLICGRLYRSLEND